MRSLMMLLLFGSLTLNGMRAAEPAFDLVGPKVDVHVKRGDATLPIGQVPYLLPGDRLWIRPDLPESQSAHYVLIVAFLRGATNPPPLDWFTRVETWNHEAREEGVFVNIPAEAQQALVFLAPETGGDFSTLTKAVRGRPRCLCPRHSGSAGRQPRPHAARCLPGRGQGHPAQRPQSPQGAR